MPKCYEPSSYAELLAIPEFAKCRDIFLHTGWGPFLVCLQVHDDGISLQFALGFDGRMERVGSLAFLAFEDSIASTTKFPLVGDRWFKHHQLPRPSYNRVFKPKFQNVYGAKGYSKEWIKNELINPLIFITKLITCEGRYSFFKACHFRLLAHFQFNKALNFPFYFLKSLQKISSQVRKNVANSHNSLFHHGLIKLFFITELTKQGNTRDEFLYQFSNPHITFNTNKRSIGLGTVTPSKPHSPKTPNPPTQTISLSEQKAKKIVDSPATSSGKKTKNPTDNSPLPSTPIDPPPKKLQDPFQQEFPLVPTNIRGANRFKGESFRRSTRSVSGNTNVKPPSTSYHIPVSFDHESPHKRLKEIFVEEFEPDREVKSKPIPSHKHSVTPTSQMHTSSSKVDITSTSINGSMPSSFETSDHTPIIDKLQQENA
jgi:hypothetical protein